MVAGVFGYVKRAANTRTLTISSDPHVITPAGWTVEVDGRVQRTERVIHAVVTAVRRIDDHGGIAATHEVEAQSGECTAGVVQAERRRSGGIPNTATTKITDVGRSACGDAYRIRIRDESRGQCGGTGDRRQAVVQRRR